MACTGYAFVIGGGSGIAQSVCMSLARNGCKGILVADINVETAQQTAKNCRRVATDSDFRAESIHVDVTCEDSVMEATTNMMTLFGRIDYCINGAGVMGSLSPVGDCSLQSFRQIMDINVQGTFLILRAVTAAMTRQQARPIDPTMPTRGTTRGAIVNLGSMASLLAVPQSPHYVASKHAVAGLTKSAAMDYIGDNIRVNCVCPSFVDTPLMRNLFKQAPHIKPIILSQLPSGRLALAEEVADVVLFLCSPASSYINGGVLAVDGASNLGPNSKL